ncbi:MAG TPA: hypothetical protein VMK83_06180 [Gaiellaceae bacterium]|nr:hypothetical protein [Gaiellaceae bacterium]
MSFRFCDDFGSDGFGWIVDESMARTSHALAVDGKVWLVDPVAWPDAIERAGSLGEPAGVMQLLDRHNRDCAALAERLGVPHTVVPDTLPGTQFECIPIMQRKRWSEIALWWPNRRTLVLADALGANRFFTGGKASLGVHLLLRLTPPKKLGALDPERILVGHGEGLSGAGAADALRDALRTSRRRLPGVLVRLPLSGR